MTFLPQLWTESIGLSASFAPMYILICNEVCGLIDRRHWNLVGRGEVRNSPNSESANHHIDQSARPLYRGTILRSHVYDRSADVAKYSRLSRVDLIIFPTIAIRHHDL